MHQSRFVTVARALARGYRNFFQTLIYAAGSAAVVVAAGAVIVFPLWLLATSSPGTYTLFVVLALGLGVVTFVIRWFAKEAATGKNGARTLMRKLVRVLLKIALVAFLVFGTYLDILLFQIQETIQGVVLGLALMVGLGLLFSGSGRRGGPTLRDTE